MISSPTTSLAPRGTINPRNPMSPAKLTELPAIPAAHTRNRRRYLLTGTPSENAVSSPSESSSVVADQVHTNPVTVKIPDDLTADVARASLWDGYNKRCIACGRCNFVCPTCTCFTMQDLYYSDNADVGRRRQLPQEKRLPRHQGTGADCISCPCSRRSSGSQISGCAAADCRVVRQRNGAYGKRALPSSSPESPEDPVKIRSCTNR